MVRADSNLNASSAACTARSAEPKRSATELTSDRKHSAECLQGVHDEVELSVNRRKDGLLQVRLLGGKGLEIDIRCRLPAHLRHEVSHRRASGGSFTYADNGAKEGVVAFVKLPNHGSNRVCRRQTPLVRRRVHLEVLPMQLNNGRVHEGVYRHEFDIVWRQLVLIDRACERG